MMSPTPINYIELPVTDMKISKQFYSDCFGWDYTDYGPHYAAINNAGLDGGLDASGGEHEASRQPGQTGALIVLFDQNLEACQARVEKAGGTIHVPIFSFPGGRRFHFIDPSGNELAVWAKDEPALGD